MHTQTSNLLPHIKQPSGVHVMSRTLDLILESNEALRIKVEAVERTNEALKQQRHELQSILNRIGIKPNLDLGDLGALLERVA